MGEPGNRSRGGGGDAEEGRCLSPAEAALWAWRLAQHDEEYHSEELARGLAGVAAGLRRMADRVEQEAGGPGPAARRVEVVQRLVLSGIATLGLERLVGLVLAAEAARTAAEGMSARSGAASVPSLRQVSTAFRKAPRANGREAQTVLLPLGR